MSEYQASAGARSRLRPPSWRDGRLLVGVVLVLASVALGARAVAAADRTVEAYAAAVTLPAGHVLAAGDLAVVRVHLPSGVAAYSGPGRPPPAAGVLLRTVARGELLPAGAVGPADTLDRSTVALVVDPGLPDGVAAGRAVDVWASPRAATGSGSYLPPRRIAEGATVVGARAPQDALSGTTGIQVQLLLGRSEVPTVLDALANQARIALVPAVAR